MTIYKIEGTTFSFEGTIEQFREQYPRELFAYTEGHLLSWATENGFSVTTRLPDTVDPRGPKGK